MLLVVVVLITLIAVLIHSRLRLPSVNAGGLGWMSEQWLAEYRASHPQ